MAVYSNMYYQILIFSIVFIVLKSIRINIGFLINMVVIGGLLGYMYYNSREMDAKKKDLALKISAKEETQLEHIDNDTFNYIDQLSAYDFPNIHEAIVYLNYFYGDIKHMNRSALIKADDNRRNAVNLLLSASMSIENHKVGRYMKILDAIKTKTEKDYRNAVSKYNKLEKYGPNDSPISMGEPVAKDYYFNENFSLV